MSKVLVPLASGFEEIEAVSIIDVLRRAGIEVTCAGVEGVDVVGANGISIKADRLIDGLSADDFDMIVLPGGVGGTEILTSNATVQRLLREFDEKNLLIGAICAAPVALDNAGVLKDGFTCYPSFEDSIKASGYTSDKSVVETDNVLTSRGPATAICFALQIVKKLVGEETYKGLKEGLLAVYCD